MQEQQCYQVLEILPGASLAEVKAAYRKLVKQYHPDLSGAMATGGKFTEIVHAYRTLAANPRSLSANPQHRQKAAAYKAAQKPGFTASPNRLHAYIARYGRILLGAKEPALRCTAASSLGRLGRVSAYAYLRRGLWDTDEEVVLAVVKAVAALEIKQAGGELAALFVRTGRRVKLAILELAIKQQVIRTYNSILSLALQDEDPVVRRWVINAGS